METDLLKRVIDTEKEIRQAVEIEQADADVWLAHVTEDHRKRVNGEEERLRHHFADELAELRRRAQQEADELLRQTGNYCERLRAIPDGAVSAAIRRHLRDILP